MSEMPDMSDAAAPHAEAQTPEVIESAVAPVQKPAMLRDRLALHYGIDPKGLTEVIRKNIISIPSGEPPATAEELFLVMSTMEQYGLNPFVRQIYAFRSKGKLVISVPIDGWVVLANRQRGFRGVTYEYPMNPEGTTAAGTYQFVKTKDGKMCWPWVKAICHADGRAPTEAFAFLDEWYLPSGRTESNWAKHPCHRLKMKAFCLAVREAFGIALYDEVDVEQFRYMDSKEDQLAEGAASVTAQIHAKMDKARALMPPPEEEPELGNNGEPIPNINPEPDDDLDWLGANGPEVKTDELFKEND